MATITTRSGKGSPLTNNEVDANFTNLNTDKAELSGANFTGSIDVTGSVVADGLTVDGNALLTGQSTTIKPASSSVPASLIIQSNSGASGGNDRPILKFRDATGTGGFNFKVNGDAGNAVQLQHVTSSGTKDRLRISYDGDISFYEDTGTTPKMVWSAANEDLNFADGVKATFGAGDDLEIFSNGSTALLKAGNATSDIRIESDNRIVIADRGFNEAFAVFNDDSDVKLYHDGSQKFATTSTGADISGVLTADGLTVDGESDLNATITITHANPRIKFIENNTTNANTQFSNDGGDFAISTMNDAESTFTKRFNLDHATGDISFYNDSAAQGLFWDSSTSRLGLGATSPSAPIHVIASSPELRLQDSDDNGYLSFNHNGANSYISTTQGALLFRTGGTSEKFRINADGSSVFSGSVSTGGEVNLRLDSTGDGVNGYDINWLNSATQGTDDRLALIRVTNEGGDGSNRGGKLSFLTRQSGNANFNSALVLNKSGNATFSGSVTATNTILNTGSTTVSAILRGGDGNSKNLVFQKQTGSAQQAKISAVGDDLRFSTGSAEQLKLDQNGNLNLYNGSLMVGSTTAPTAKLDVVRGGTTGLSSVNARTVALFQNNNSAGTVISINAPATGYAGIFLGDDSSESVGQIKLDNTSNTLQFVSAGGSPEMTIQSNNVNIPNGSLMVGSTTAPSAKLQAQVNNTATPAQIATDSNAVLLLENTNASGSAGIRLRGGNGAGVLMYGENNSTDKFYLTPRNDTGKSFTLDHVGNGVFQGSVTSTGLNVTSNTPVLTFTESDQSKEYQIGSYGAAFAVFDATANAFRYVIDTSGNVGIGVSDPDVKLEVSGSARFAQENHSWTFDDTINNRLGFVKKAGNYPVLSSASGIPIIFSTSDNSNLSSSVASQTLTERMRIASNGTLYHGKTADSLNTGGLQTLISGQTSITQSYTEPLRLNRMSSQGAIQKFYYNGAEVGSIGVMSGNNLIVGGTVADHAGFEFGTNRITPQIAGNVSNGIVDLGYPTQRFKDLHLSGNVNLGGTGAKVTTAISGDLITGQADTGLRFYDGGDAIIPRSTSDGQRNGTTDLGASNARFKDLYLSGGVYLGGTGAANKLDDYEEGTWTPTALNYDGTLTVDSATYVKVGALVTVKAKVSFDATADGSGVNLSSFPFVTTGIDKANGGFIVSSTVSSAARMQAIGTGSFYLMTADDSNVTYTTMASTSLEFVVIYETTA